MSAGPRDPASLAVLERLPDAVLVLDGGGSLVHANARAARQLGLTAEARGAPLDRWITVEDATGTPVPLPPPRPTVGDRLAEQIVRVRRPDGTWRHLAVTGRHDGEGWVLTLRSAGHSSALERRQGDVVATVSHELRSPLASVRGFTRTLLGRWGRLTDDQKLALLEAVDQDAERITHLLTDLLEVARIDARRVPLRRAPVDLAELVEDVVAQVRRREDAASRELRTDVAADLPRVEVDRDRIAQVLTNLLDNALRYAPDGAIEVSGRPDGVGVRLTVRDHGPGIDPALRREVFRKFGRGRDRHRPGTGLGLYLSQGLTTAHGGRLWLDDAAATPGATFHVWLPVAPDGRERGALASTLADPTPRSTGTDERRS